MILGNAILGDSLLGGEGSSTGTPGNIVAVGLAGSVSVRWELLGGVNPEESSTDIWADGALVGTVAGSPAEFEIVGQPAEIELSARRSSTLPGSPDAEFSAYVRLAWDAVTGALTYTATVGTVTSTTNVASAVVGPLATGTHTASATATDANGLVSVASAAISVVVDTGQASPTFAVALDDDGTGFDLTWATTAPTVALYCNYSIDFADLETQPIMDWPVATFTGSALAGNWTPATLPDGTWQFLLRAVRADGAESANSEPELITLPAVPLCLAPVIQSAILAASDLVLTWVHDQGQAVAASFQVSIDGGAASAVAVGMTGYPVGIQSATSTPGGTPAKVRVGAKDTADVIAWSASFDIVSASAPSAPANLRRW